MTLTINSSTEKWLTNFQVKINFINGYDYEEDDMMEMDEELLRMREHLFEEVDKNNDKMISLQEFLDYTKTEDFEKPNKKSYETVDDALDKGNIFTREELDAYKKVIESSEAKLKERIEKMRQDSKQVMDDTVKLNQDKTRALKNGDNPTSVNELFKSREEELAVRRKQLEDMAKTVQDLASSLSDMKNDYAEKQLEQPENQEKLANLEEKKQKMVEKAEAKMEKLKNENSQILEERMKEFDRKKQEMEEKMKKISEMNRL